MSVPALGDRGLFPELDALAYLNHAGISPVSLDVKYAIRAILDDYGRRGAAASARLGRSSAPASRRSSQRSSARAARTSPSRRTRRAA